MERHTRRAISYGAFIIIDAEDTGIRDKRSRRECENGLTAIRTLVVVRLGRVDRGVMGRDR